MLSTENTISSVEHLLSKARPFGLTHVKGQWSLPVYMIQLNTSKLKNKRQKPASEISALKGSVISHQGLNCIKQTNTQYAKNKRQKPSVRNICLERFSGLPSGFELHQANQHSICYRNKNTHTQKHAHPCPCTNTSFLSIKGKMHTDVSSNDQPVIADDMWQGASCDKGVCARTCVRME